MTKLGDANWQSYPLKQALPRRGVETRAFYLTMRDGIKIAVDVSLPKHLPDGVKLPAVMRGTRYFRAYNIRWPFYHFLRNLDEITRRLLANGYAVMEVDARGSGASYGYRPCPWSYDEVQD